MQYIMYWIVLPVTVPPMIQVDLFEIIRILDTI